MSAHDGGPAFPQVESQQVGERGEYHMEISSSGGMSLRDYFAAKAMQAIRSDASFPLRSDAAAVADRAYAIADAMLDAGSKT